jgi:hypothetical protein
MVVAVLAFGAGTLAYSKSRVLVANCKHSRAYMLKVSYMFLAFFASSSIFGLPLLGLLTR